MPAILQDIGYVWRGLARNRAFTAVVVLTLALGIGANTAVFSVVNAVLLRPLSYPDAERLVWLTDYGPGWGDNMVAPAGYTLWRDAARSFESMIAYGDLDLALWSENEATQERISFVTDNFWASTGAQPELARLFGTGERDTIVLSHALFERRFGGDPRVIGRAVALNGHSFTITGVLPRSFQFLFPLETSEERRDIDAYVPIPDPVFRVWSVTMPQYEALTANVGPAPWSLYVVGKLKRSVPFAQMRAEMETIFSRVKREHYKPWQSDLILNVAPLQERITGKASAALAVMLGAVGFVLLIATVNIGMLLVARGASRRKEIAIRVALGAGRLRLIRQHLVESTLLALLGGSAGLVVARWSIGLMARLGSEAIPRVSQAQIDARVLAFTLAVSLFTGLLFGLAPALAARAVDLRGALMDGAWKLGSGRIRVRGLLAGAELALAMILLIGTGLMLKSFWRMNAHPPGFDPEKILVMKVSLYGERYAAWLQQDAYLRELLRRIETAPGVQAAGLHMATLNTAVKVEGAPEARPGEEPYAAVEGVSVGYLRAMGVPLIRGEWPRDDSFHTFVVNEAFVRRVLGGGNPIGRHLSGAVMNGTIVGVVADFKTWQLDTEPSPEVYIPYQLPPSSRSARVVVRISGDPRAVAPMIRKLAASTDPTQPVYGLQTLDQTLADSIAPRRFNLFLLGTFTIVALAMALLGVYGVMAYLVSQRTREIGIRMALGASPRDALGLVVAQGLGVALMGVAGGLAGAFGLTRFVAGLLYGVKPADPMTFAAVSAVLVAAALLASYLPARRAAKVDPMVALRYE